jgi:hypothetical protein
MAGAGDMVMRGSSKTCQAAVGQFRVYLIAVLTGGEMVQRDVARSSCKLQVESGKKQRAGGSVEEFGFMSGPGHRL